MTFSLSQESLAAASKSTADSLLSIFDTGLSSVEKLSSLNFLAARSTLAEQVENANTLFDARDPNQLLAIQGSLIQPAVEKLVAYSRNFLAISVETQDAFVKLAESRHAELNQGITTGLERIVKASGNSELAVSAFKSALSAANSAFDQASKTARQVADIAEASVNAATSATVQAIASSDVTPASRKKAA